jgi:hypothetical protein
VGGEAPVTPVSTLDSSFLTFPTNRAITGMTSPIMLLHSELGLASQEVDVLANSTNENS